MAKKNEKKPKEASNIFESIIRTSVKDNPKPEPKKKNKK
jgi:hypothetical protein